MCHGGHPGRKGCGRGKEQGTGSTGLAPAPKGTSSVIRRRVSRPTFWVLNSGSPRAAGPVLAFLSHPSPAPFHQQLPTRGSGRVGSHGTYLPTSLSGSHPVHPKLHPPVCRRRHREAVIFGQALGFARPVPPSDVHSAARGTASQFIILLDSHTAPAQLEPRVLAINMLCPD